MNERISRLMDGELDEAADFEQCVVSLRSEVCPALARVIDKSLAKDPARRYASAAELVADLEAARDPATSQRTGPADAAPPVPVRAAPTPAAPRTRRP